MAADTPTTTLEQQLILQPFMCRQFGFGSLRDILDCIARVNAAWERADSHGQGYEMVQGQYISGFAEALAVPIRNLPDTPVTEADLLRYDRNIIRISREIGMVQRSTRQWKPFQYAALLFTERYLDLYFNHPHKLLAQLNTACEQHNRQAGTHTRNTRKRNAQRHNAHKHIDAYRPEQLRTLAFQSATGSGKTLIMHANIKQYMHYMETSSQHHRFNRIILITPDEGMSRQHLSELHASRMSALLFTDNIVSKAQRGGAVIDIIDIHKLDRKRGIKRVDVAGFEDNNLVIVDEGHLGASSGKVWRNHRKTLAQNGFTLEYSATFNQAVTGSSADKKALRQDYAKCLLFDYSYRHFYQDGYGKDYHISNLAQDDSGSFNRTYLLACLLQFFQQRRIYAEHNHQWKEYQIAKPLLVFLCNRVIQTTSSTQSDRENISDVHYLVEFLAWVISHPEEVRSSINAILTGSAALHDADGNDMFRGSFDYLVSGNAAINTGAAGKADTVASKADIYELLCADLFGARGQFRMIHAVASDEIHLSVGAGTRPFAIINIGDTPRLYQQIAERNNPNIKAEKDNFAPRYFPQVDDDVSQVSMVIGARKFIAGWNCWRVSTMGLLHVGKSEGPQIIQMFGRGVRLRGKNMCLKRHRAYTDAHPPHSDLLVRLETLNVFGLKANYMQEFKNYLSQEGIATEWEIIRLPVCNNFSEVKGLRIPRLPHSKKYEASAERIGLYDARADEKITLDLRPVLQHIESTIDHD